MPPALAEAYQAKQRLRYSGFIAQEVDEAARSLGYAFSGVDAPEDAAADVYGLRYAEFVVPLVKATQELHEKVKALEALVEAQNAQLASYQHLLSRLEQHLVASEEAPLATASADSEPASSN